MSIEEKRGKVKENRRKEDIRVISGNETDKIGYKTGGARVKRKGKNADVNCVISCNMRQWMAAKIPWMEKMEVSASLFCETGMERAG